MKKIILSAAAAFSVLAVSAQQATNDSVYVGASSTNNVWYSLANDSVTSAAATNWHLSFATSASQTGSLTATIQANTLAATVYEIPGADVTDFAAADTAGITTWTPLYNSEYFLGGGGAINSVGGTTNLDYGFGNYNTVSHGVDASRIFVAKIGTQYIKFMVSLVTMQGKYTLTYDFINNTNFTTQDITIAPYVAKNFVYFNFVTEAIVDREPASSSWDLLFGSYHGLTSGVMYPLAGILQNDGVEAVQVGGVNAATYVDFASHEMSDSMNVIGADWKAYTGGAYVIAPGTVYFIKAKNGDIWKVVMRGYAGGSAGKMSFSKQKISSVGLDENGEEIFASLYPNPAAHTASVVVKNMNGTLNVYNMTGALVYSQDVTASNLTVIELPVADFSNGAYQVVCTSGAVVSAQRLIVQH